MKADAISQFSHVRPTDTAFRCEGLRDFFLYRDLGIAEATGGRLLVQLVKADRAPEKGTGWVITHAPDSGAQALMAVRMVPKTVVPDVRRAVSTTVRTAASPSAAHMAR